MNWHATIGYSLVSFLVGILVGMVIMLWTEDDDL